MLAGITEWIWDAERKMKGWELEDDEICYWRMKTMN